MDNAEIECSATQDSEHEFLHAVSLIAAMEGASELNGHAALLPHLGMARAELTDFGQRRVPHFHSIDVTDLDTGLAELDQRLTSMLAVATVEQHRVRIEAALRLLRRGVAAFRRQHDLR